MKQRLQNIVWSMISAVAMCMSAATAAASPYAGQVVDYVSGTGGATGFSNPATVLGEPTRFTVPPSGGAVTPFNAPFGTSELLSLGQGGSITIRFDRHAFDNPTTVNFGIDFLIFGNTFMGLGSGGVATGAFSEPGSVEVSQNGVDWFSVPAVADTLYPTMGYSDITTPFSSTPGAVLSDFTKPVDPNVTLTGLTMPQIVAAYDGSGGGTGVDISGTGLAWIQYVRVSNPVSSAVTPEIDAFAIAAPSADFNDDSVVNADDIDILWQIVRGQGSDPGNNDSADLDGDTLVTENDVDYMLASLLTAGPNRRYGDADLDGSVGGLDFTAWRLRAGTGWAHGDFDGDGGIGGLDFTLWRTRPTQYPGSEAPNEGNVGVGLLVPEPSAFVLAAVGLAAMLSCRRPRRQRRN